jgi:hypothetical protein
MHLGGSTVLQLLGYNPGINTSIQRVSNKLQERVLHLKKKKDKIYVNIVRKWVDFQFNWKTTFYHKYFNYVVCNLNWYNTFTIHVPNLITIGFLLFIKSQFTINAQNVLHLNQLRPGHTWSWTTVPFQWSPGEGGSKRFGRHKKCVGEVSLHFQLELNAVEVLSVHTDNILKEWGQ